MASYKGQFIQGKMQPCHGEVDRRGWRLYEAKTPQQIICPWFLARGKKQAWRVNEVRGNPCTD